MTGKKKNTCTFCRASGPGMPVVEVPDPSSRKIFICEDCVHNCLGAFNQDKDRKRPTASKQADIPLPRELYDHLSGFVIGQEEAKKRLSVQVSLHYQRLLDGDDMAAAKQGLCTTMVKDPELADVVIDKSNMLLVGPTGSGKTLLARSLAKRMGVPIAIGDATTLTEAGYVGEDVENLLVKLLAAADYDIESAQRGIIYIDEIDKLRKTGGNTSITRDVSGEGVQQSLLKLIEGTMSNVPPAGGRKHPEQQYIQIDTTNILFICAGAFTGLEDIIRRRLNQNRLGFVSNGQPAEGPEARNQLLRQVTHDDLVEFGIIPELAGRLPVIAPLEELSLDDLKLVLTEPKNAIVKQERKKLAYRGVKLVFAAEALDEIARKAIDMGTGARALRSVMESVMNDIHFHLPPGYRGELVITKEVVTGEAVVFDSPPKMSAA